MKELPSWQTLERREVLSAPPWITVVRETVVLPNGKVVDDFYMVRLHEFAVVIALTADGQLLLERQYRHAPQCVTIQMPAGDLEPGEDALAAAERELLEETGYVCDGLRFLGSMVIDDNRGCGKAHYFFGTNARPAAGQHLDETEDIEVLLMPLEDLYAAIRRGETVSMPSVAGLGIAHSFGLI